MSAGLMPEHTGAVHVAVSCAAAMVRRCDTLDVAIDTFATRVAAWLIRKHYWSPIGKRLCIAIDDSADSRLAGVVLEAVVRGYDVDHESALTRLLVESDLPIDYAGHYRETAIRWLVAEPCLRGRRMGRLPLRSWAVARLVDARSFADSAYFKTIGIARLRSFPARSRGEYRRRSAEEW